MFFQTAIMTCRYVGTISLVCPFAQNTFFEKRVTHYTRIRSASFHIFVNEMLDNNFFKFFTYIGYMMFYT